MKKKALDADVSFEPGFDGNPCLYRTSWTGDMLETVQGYKVFIQPSTTCVYTIGFI